MTQSEEQQSWSNFYKASAGRPPRPFFIEAIACCVDKPAPTAARWAVDLGCGDGTETFALLQAGWHVLAIDQQSEAITLVQSKVPPELQSRLQTRVTAFEELSLPVVDFIYAGFSLPFCTPQHFPTLWTTIVTALCPRGLLAAQLFGEHDSWASDLDMTFHMGSEVHALLEPFEVKVLREVEEDGQTAGGPKHWHVFHIIARKR